jgi:hypothetical protein
MVFEGVATGKYPGIMTTVVTACGDVSISLVPYSIQSFEWAFELTFVTTNFLPVTFYVSEQIVRSGKATLTIFTNMRSVCGF